MEAGDGREGGKTQGHGTGDPDNDNDDDNDNDTGIDACAVVSARELCGSQASPYPEFLF
jgi:hypothetical protein